MRALATILVSAFVCGGASACTCIPPDKPNCEAAYALLGTAGETKEVECPDDDLVFDFNVFIGFTVKEVLKQPQGSSISAGDVLEITTASNSAACGFLMQKGETYLLYPNESGPAQCEALETESKLSVNLCQGHLFNPPPEDIEEFKDECLPKEPTCEERCEERCQTACERFCN